MALIDIKDLTFEYPGGIEPIFEKLNLQLDTAWKLGLIGRNGYGKTTFLKLLMGEYDYEGNIAKPVPMAYFPSTIKNKGNKTLEILERLQLDFQMWKLKMEMNLLRVEEDILYRPFCTLSGGEQTKVLLALLFYVDIISRIQIENMILEFSPTMIVVEHDRRFVDRVATDIVQVRRVLGD